MIDIRVYCEMLNKENKPDIFELCKQKRLIPNYATELKSLNHSERQKYEREVKIYFDGMRLIWKDIIQKNLKYKKPNLVNSQL